MVSIHKHLVKSSFEKNFLWRKEERHWANYTSLHCGITALICQLAISEDERHSRPEHNPNTFACVILPTQANMEVQL